MKHVSEADKAKDDMPVELTGKLVKSLGDENTCSVMKRVRLKLRLMMHYGAILKYRMKPQ